MEKDGREYPRSPVLAAAGVVLRGDEVLLIKRGGPPSEGIWSFPGGAVRVGERLVDAVAREVGEETGLNVRVGPPVALAERIYRDGEGRVMYHYLIWDFLCLVESGEPRPGSDAADLRFFPLKELSRVDPAGDLERVARAARSAALGEVARLVLI